MYWCPQSCCWHLAASGSTLLPYLSLCLSNYNTYTYKYNPMQFPFQYLCSTAVGCLYSSHCITASLQHCLKTFTFFKLKWFMFIRNIKLQLEAGEVSLAQTHTGTQLSRLARLCAKPSKPPPRFMFTVQTRERYQSPHPALWEQNVKPTHACKEDRRCQNKGSANYVAFNQHDIYLFYSSREGGYSTCVHDSDLMHFPTWQLLSWPRVQGICFLTVKLQHFHNDITPESPEAMCVRLGACFHRYHQRRIPGMHLTPEEKHQFSSPTQTQVLPHTDTDLAVLYCKVLFKDKKLNTWR